MLIRSYLYPRGSYLGDVRVSPWAVLPLGLLLSVMLELLAKLLLLLSTSTAIDTLSEYLLLLLNLELPPSQVVSPLFMHASETFVMLLRGMVPAVILGILAGDWKGECGWSPRAQTVDWQTAGLILLPTLALTASSELLAKETGLTEWLRGLAATLEPRRSYRLELVSNHTGAITTIGEQLCLLTTTFCFGVFHLGWAGHTLLRANGNGIGSALLLAFAGAVLLLFPTQFPTQFLILLVCGQVLLTGRSLWPAVALLVAVHHGSLWLGLYLPHEPSVIFSLLKGHAEWVFVVSGAVCAVLLWRQQHTRQPDA